jgi:hypothetical protein
VQVSQILAELDSEIERLQQARSLLAGSVTPRRRGRPPLSGQPKAAATAPKKRRLSPEERQKIADAMKRRWAERKKAAAKK